MFLKEEKSHHYVPFFLYFYMIVCEYTNYIFIVKIILFVTYSMLGTYCFSNLKIGQWV